LKKKYDKLTPFSILFLFKKRLFTLSNLQKLNQSGCGRRKKASPGRVAQSFKKKESSSQYKSHTKKYHPIFLTKTNRKKISVQFESWNIGGKRFLFFLGEKEGLVKRKHIFMFHPSFLYLPVILIFLIMFHCRLWCDLILQHTQLIPKMRVWLQGEHEIIQSSVKAVLTFYF